MSSITRGIVHRYVFNGGWWGSYNWAGCRAMVNAGEGASMDGDTIRCMAARGSDAYQIKRSTFTYDTSAVPVGATVHSVTLHWWRSFERNNQNADPNTYICPVSATGNNADYVNQVYFGAYVGIVPNSYGYDINNGGGSPNVFVDIALTPTCIIKGGTTILGLRMGHDYINSPPGNEQKNNWMEGGTTQTTLIITYTTTPAVTTGVASALQPISAILSGTVTDYGSGTVSQRGVCWSTTANPTTANPKATTGSDAISVQATGLLPGTLYHFRAYVITENSTQYGADASFRTPGGAILFNLL